MRLLDGATEEAKSSSPRMGFRGLLDATTADFAIVQPLRHYPYLVFE